jgi:hypothetical protein
VIVTTAVIGADRDLVAVDQPALAVDLVPVDPGAVAAAEIFDLEDLAHAADRGVEPRHAGRGRP